MNVISMPEREKKKSCPDCLGEMYRLNETRVEIWICKECGSSIEPEDKKTCFDEEETGEMEENVKSGQECLNKMFNKFFMKKYTCFESFVDFIVASGLLPKNTEIITYDVFKKINMKKLDDYVRKNTDFNSWNEMFDLATGKYLRIDF